jgi:hypothetical protein
MCVCFFYYKFQFISNKRLTVSASQKAQNVFPYVFLDNKSMDNLISLYLDLMNQLVWAFSRAKYLTGRERRRRPGQGEVRVGGGFRKEQTHQRNHPKKFARFAPARKFE